jgi:thioredoxin reductase (NADPH)
MDSEGLTRLRDVLLVGAGPAGIAAALHFRSAGLDVLQVEDGDLAQTIRNFPTGVALFSTRGDLALPGYPFGPDPSQSPTREDYIAYLEQTAREAGLAVATHTKAVSAEAAEGVHHVVLEGPDGTRRRAAAASVVVASGGYFSPNVLGIPGEEEPHVHHHFRRELIEAGGRYLVVGGRNSAVEAAVTIAESDARVILAYRKARLPRAKIKPWLLPRFDAARRAGRIIVRYRTVPREITSEGAALADGDGRARGEPADLVFLLTGYGPDYRLLRNAGVPFHRRTGRPLFTAATLETRTPGVFLCGTVALRVDGEQATIENTRDHALRMLDTIRLRSRRAIRSPHAPS